MSKLIFFCFTAALGTFSQDMRAVYCCRRHKLFIKTWCEAHCFYIVDSDVKLNNARKIVMLCFPCNNGQAGAPKRHVIGTLPIYLTLVTHNNVPFLPIKHDQIKCVILTDRSVV